MNTPAVHPLEGMHGQGLLQPFAIGCMRSRRSTAAAAAGILTPGLDLLGGAPDTLCETTIAWLPRFLFHHALVAT